MEINNKLKILLLILPVIFAYTYYSVDKNQRDIIESAKPVLVHRIKECNELIASNKYDPSELKHYEQWDDYSSFWSDKEKANFCMNEYRYIFGKDSIIKINEHTTFEDIKYARHRNIEIQLKSSRYLYPPGRLFKGIIKRGECYNSYDNGVVTFNLTLLLNKQCY